MFKCQVSASLKKLNCLVGACVFTLLVLLGNFHLAFEMLEGLCTLIQDISELTVGVTLKFYSSIHI